MKRLVLCGALALALLSCGSSRSTFARYPGAPAAFDRAGADPKALEIADKVFAAAGGPGNWDQAKQIKWRQTVTSDGKVTIDYQHVWDRWNGRHGGRLYREDGELVVGYDLYGSHTMGFVQQGQKQQNLDEASRTRYIKILKDAYNIDTAVMTLPFLMLEPGTKLEYVGPAKDDAGNENYDDIKVTFADPMRADIEFHAIIDRTSNLPHRVEMLKTGTMTKVGYTYSDWTTVGGLKFAQKRGNLGYSGETTEIKDISVGKPEDELFIAPITH